MQDSAVGGTAAGSVYEQPGILAAASTLVTFWDSRAFSFSVWNNAAVTSKCRSNSSHLVPISMALFFSGPNIWFGFPGRYGAEPPYWALVPSNSAPTGFDDVA